MKGNINQNNCHGIKELLHLHVYDYRCLHSVTFPVPSILSALPIIHLHHQKAIDKVPNVIPISFSRSFYGKT